MSIYNLTEEKNLLRNDLQNFLRQQGFIVNGGEKLSLSSKTKEEIKKIQILAKNNIIKSNANFLKKNQKIVKKFLISGKDIDPYKIRLEIRPVLTNTQEEILFKWWNLAWWSMPYQRPFGRQMRFILWDVAHNAPFGLIALQSPILKQAVRDKSLGIPHEELDYWVNRSMYAQRVGALPPYNEMLGGKMVALTLITNEIRNAYNQKYKHCKTLIENRVIEPDLLFITTTSAFGRSSIYNRLKYKQEYVAEKLGYTQGYGSFQIPDDIYERLISFLKNLGINALRGYGNGPSRKLKLINLACRKLGLPNYTYHGIKREYYLFSFVHNLKEVIAREEEPIYKNYTFDELFEFWRNRWLLGRVLKSNKWREIDAGNFIDDFVNSLNKGFL